MCGDEDHKRAPQLADAVAVGGGADREREKDAVPLAEAGDGILGVVRDGILCEVHELAHLARNLNHFSFPFLGGVFDLFTLGRPQGYNTIARFSGHIISIF